MPELRPIKVKDVALRYKDFSNVLQDLTGELTEGSCGIITLKVKDIYVYYIDFDGNERKLLGTLTGETLMAGKTDIRGDYIFYGDKNNDERYIPLTLIKCGPYGRLYYHSNPHTDFAYTYKFTPGETFTANLTTWRIGKSVGGVTPDYIQYRLFLSQEDGAPVGAALRTKNMPCPPADFPATHIVEFDYDNIELAEGQAYTHGLYFASSDPNYQSTYISFQEVEYYTCCPCANCWAKWTGDYFYFSTINGGGKIYGV